MTPLDLPDFKQISHASDIDDVWDFQPNSTKNLEFDGFSMQSTCQGSIFANDQWVPHPINRQIKNPFEAEQMPPYSAGPPYQTSTEFLMPYKL